MAGNTKLVGFLSGNRVELERWGAKVIVTLDEESVATLRSACFKDLPTKPVQRHLAYLDDVQAKYDHEVGRVLVNMSPEAAAYLASAIDAMAGSEPKELAEKRGPWKDAISSAVKAHADYHDTDEPGAGNEKRSS